MIRSTFVGLLILISIFSRQTQAAEEDSMKLAIGNLIKSAEIKYDLPPGLLGSLIYVESSWNHSVKVHHDGASNATSYGLTQIQLASARFIQRLKAKRDDIHLKKKDLITPSQLMNPETNIDYGAAYLKWILDTHNQNVSWALSCYNSGPNSYICKHKKFNQYVGLVFNAFLHQL